MDIKLTVENEAQARRACRELSRKHLGQYVTLATCFELLANVSPKLNKEAPGDFPHRWRDITFGGWYCLNGKVKRFTEKQISVNQNIGIGRD